MRIIPEDHKTVTITFFWWSFCFGKCCGALSASSHCAERLRLCKIQFSQQVTIRLSKRYFWLQRRRAGKISKLLHLWFSFNSWGTHLSIILTLSVNFRWREMVVGEMHSFSAWSLTVFFGFFSTIAHKTLCSQHSLVFPGLRLWDSHPQFQTLPIYVEWYVHSQNGLQMQH